MRKKKRLCALLLCMAMLLGCTGCGSTTGSCSSGTGTQPHFGQLTRGIGSPQ